jgi:hypothetical protein
MGGVARPLELFYGNIQPEVRSSGDVLLNAWGRSEWVALRVHVQAWCGASDYGGQNVWLEESRAELDKEGRPACKAIVHIECDIEANEKREDEQAKGNVFRGDRAQGGSEAFVVRHGIENESCRRLIQHGIGRLKFGE